MPLFIYLSPHFDDAVLSCGGLLRANAERGERAVLVTVCAGKPDYTNLSKFAEVQHRQWGRLADPIATRRAEDEEAARRLGVATHYLDIPDCIYRRDTHGRPVVYSNRSLFGPVHPDEQPLVKRIAQELLSGVRRRSDTRILAPLAAGRHVDHQLVRDAARQLAGLGYNVAWYEDFPYAAVRGAVTRARSAFGAGDWECAVFPIDIERKLEALRAYQSQLKSTFRNERDMEARVRAYNQAVAGGLESSSDARRRAGGQDDSGVAHPRARDLKARAGGQDKSGSTHPGDAGRGGSRARAEDASSAAQRVDAGQDGSRARAQDASSSAQPIDTGRDGSREGGEGNGERIWHLKERAPRARRVTPALKKQPTASSPLPASGRR